MGPGRDRELITDWLTEAHDYEVTTLREASTLPTEYDICLLDAAGIDAYYDELSDRCADAAAYLPHVLLLTEEQHADGRGWSMPDVSTVGDPLIDEVLMLPLEKQTLARRVENLLATRDASLKLTERERQYRELVELTPEAILLLDGDRVVYANSAAAELFGVDKDGLIDGSFSRFVPAASEAAIARTLASVPRTGNGPTEFTEHTLRNARGRDIETAVAGVTVTYGGEQVTQLLIRNLTETKRQAERLRLFGRGIEAAAHGIVVCDARSEDVPMIYANEAFCRITGYSLGEVLGQNCRFLQGENTDPETVDRIRTAVETGNAITVELLNYRKDGTPFWNRLEITPIRNDRGELTHFLGSQRDITDRIRNEQRLSVLDRILRHNVRNKTNVIRGYANTIIDEGSPPDAAAERIRSAADELYTISEQIREFDAVVRDTGELTQTVPLDAVVGDAVAALREENPDADVVFRASGSVLVDAHSTLRAALTDLLYQLGDAERPMADISLSREGDSVDLAVVDRGGAIPPEDLDLVVGGTETPLEHLQDLELWLLRWAVEQSDGEFAVDDEGGDPRIRLRFPAAELRDS
ncbi:hypothetical protein JCM30237_08130 [Halolamina litorea]|uniref:PAS domain-containing protein n=1 Tax=Halolamina litorea TaxID=1515593 RepID=A0ABD6BS27_9EURY|nr:PAS domain-containing protein [Halolamina litorea]